MTDLNPRQREVLTLIGQGKTNLQIAEATDLAEKSVKAYVTQIFKKLGVVNRTQAALLAQQNGSEVKHCPTCRCAK
jgi:DNA-binding NarL/FixJ family response regulator